MSIDFVTSRFYILFRYKFMLLAGIEIMSYINFYGSVHQRYVFLLMNIFHFPLKH